MVALHFSAWKKENQLVVSVCGLKVKWESVPGGRHRSYLLLFASTLCLCPAPILNFLVLLHVIAALILCCQFWDGFALLCL